MPGGEPEAKFSRAEQDGDPMLAATLVTGKGPR